MSSNDEGGGKKKKEINLLALSERKLKKLSYYNVLHSSLPMHASADEIKRAYHKACLKDHPDKTGRGEDDAVFLLVKSAFDTLIDPIKRRSYDSTVDFDESIPKEGVGEADFYTTYELREKEWL
jgi:DnaJ-class molecular chaperone